MSFFAMKVRLSFMVCSFDYFYTYLIEKIKRYPNKKHSHNMGHIQIPVLKITNLFSEIKLF